jgi:hypothetical protein
MSRPSRWPFVLSLLCLILATFCVIQWVREAKLREEIRQLRSVTAQPVK